MTTPNPPLDIERIARTGWVARVEYQPVLGSTNDRALECAAEGGTLPLLVLTEKQTAGRGRGTNRWWTGEGSLAFSLLLDPAMVGDRPKQPSLAALAAAVAIVETAAQYAPESRLGIRWPNDVYASQRKLAGILAEVLPDRRHVIGIGLNVNDLPADAPEELRGTVTSLHELCSASCDRTDVFIELLRRLDANFAILRDSPARIACLADTFCLQHGETLSLETGGQTIVGLCAGIGDDGTLVLDTASGRQRFASGTLGRPNLTTRTGTGRNPAS